MTTSQVLLLTFAIGFLAGLRALTPPAVAGWAAYLGWLKLPGLLSWIGTLPAAAIFALLALAELVNDKLPKTPSRTTPIPFTARILMGALTGACVATAGAQGVVAGALVGIAGALAGSFGGYQMRTRLVKALGTRDFVVAVTEDLVTIGAALWVVTRF